MDAAGFARVVPPDTLHSRALARIVAAQDWARVGILHCGDEYCQGLRRGTAARLALWHERVFVRQPLHTVTVIPPFLSFISRFP